MYVHVYFIYIVSSKNLTFKMQGVKMQGAKNWSTKIMNVYMYVMNIIFF